MRMLVAASACSLVVLAETRAMADDPPEITLDLGGGAPLVMRLVPKGSFTQGSPPSEPLREPDEAAREVTLTKDIYVGKLPVTRGQFARFVADSGYKTESEKGQSGGSGWDGAALVQRKDFTWKSPGFSQTDDHPVVLVTFGDAQAFLDWASRRAGRRLRLPTEAEFERAARAGTTTAWYSGSAEADALAIGWFKANAQGGGTRAAGTKKPNTFGLFDMSGNVYQWCSDVYAPYSAGPATNPEGASPPAGEPLRRVLRGGSWLKEPKRGRSAARYRNTPGSRNADNGFRVVSDAGVPVEALSPIPLESSAPGGPRPKSSGTTGIVGGLFVLFVIFGVGAGIILVIALLLARGLRNKPAAAAATPGAWGARAHGQGGGPRTWTISARPVTDGFWIRAPGFVAGTRVRYACVVRGAKITHEAPLTGAPQTFVYTGGPPTAIEILGTIPPDQPAWGPAQGHGGGARAPYGGYGARDRDASWDSSSSSHDPAPFLGFPRAY
jgi:formylglycine-generating enzyme required for sulfatase activity